MSLLSDLDFDGEELEVSIDHRRGGMDKLLSVLVNIGLLDKEPAEEAETVFLHLEFGDQGDPGLRFVAPCPFAENLKVADPLLAPLYLQNIKATFIQPDLSIKIIADHSGFGNDIEADGRGWEEESSSTPSCCAPTFVMSSGHLECRT